MSTITSTTALTIADLNTRVLEGGRIDPNIINILAQTNEMAEDLMFVPCNEGSTHRTTIVSGLPTGTWRTLNYGVQPEKSTTVQVRDVCGMLETYSKVDGKLIDLAKDKAAFRMSEDRPFVEGLTQNVIGTVFYGDITANPERFMGLSSRYSSLSAENADNIINAGGSSNLTSIWLVTHGDDALHGIYPDGTAAGLQVRDLGEDTLIDANGGEYQGFRTHYKWDVGLTLRDWTKCVRIANIDTNALTKNAATGADLVDLLIRAIERLPTASLPRVKIYCNRTVRAVLRRQIANKANVWLSMDEIAGKRVLAFDGIPVRRVDQLLNTETAVA